MIASLWRDLSKGISPALDTSYPAERKHLADFMRRMFPAYQTSAHIEVLAEALEWAVSTPDARLIVTMPPRHSKSLHVSENLPAWFLGNNPDKRVIAASHTAGLAYTFSRRVRNKFNDPRWPFPLVRIAGDKAAVQAWDIDGCYGGYYAVGVGGSPTGSGGDLIVIDDPLRSAADADSETVRDALWEWYQGTLRTRLEPGGSIVLTATRWHGDDLTGRLLAAQDAGGEQWKHVHMAAIDDTGVPLWAERWPLTALERIRSAVGSRVWEAQYQGAPSALEGGTFKRHWWRFWHPATIGAMPPAQVKDGKGNVIARVISEPLPPTFDDSLQSWDFSFRQTTDGSYVVGQVWGRTGANCYLVDQYRARVDFPDAVLAVRAMSGKHPRVITKLVENKANGPAIVKTLSGLVPGLIEVEPEGGKESRANAVAPYVEAGNVYLPHPDIASWVQDFLNECADFPNAKNDDQVDAMSQALLRIGAPVDDATSYSYLGDGQSEDDDDVRYTR